MPKNSKLILWCVLVAVTSFWMWVNLQIWLRGSLFAVGSPINLGILSLLFIILLSLLSLGLIMFPGRLASLYLGIIVAITYSFLFKISNLNLIGMFIMVMLFYHAHDLVVVEMKERLKMKPRALLAKGTKNFLVAFFVLASFAAYQSPAIEDFKNIKELPSSSHSFIKTVIDKTIGPRIPQEATQAQKEQVLSQVTTETTHEINTFLKPYFDYVPPGLAFALFLALWGVGWVFMWLSVFLGALLFFILKKLKFIRIEEYDIKAERLVI